jgi:molybdate transport system regulatory protein
MNQDILPLDLTQALSHDAVDKRIDILRRIGETGSISEAARSAGVSYKAAWQALETLSNLAGVPLVDKAVGGSGGGGARLTAAGQMVLNGAALLSKARADVLAQLMQESAGALSTTGWTGLALRTSMRNHLPCTIQSLHHVMGLVQVTLDLGRGQTITAKITEESAQLLGLEPQLPVMALCKATAVTIAAPHSSSTEANQLAGQITRLSHATQGGEVSMQLSSGQQLVGFATSGHGLQMGSPAVALMEESAVVIALVG